LPGLAAIVAAALVVAPAAASASWGSADWGEFVWGSAAPSVPALGPFGVALLVSTVAALGAWLSRVARQSRRDRS
jgi:hypothetical protein